MGVPKFYRWTSERYPCLSEVINENEIPEYDNLYLDMNGIIHNCSHPNDDDITFRISEEEIFTNIFAYIEHLYSLIKPQKVFFMAVDGVAPRAKMNQQRARRFMSARTAELQTRLALKKGQTLPDEKRFDSNCITPGTLFMHRLHTKMVTWVEKKIQSDPCWQNRKIYLSGHNVPGEGEHKIMDYIRYEKSKKEYDPNTRHCMYGLDADLIMLGIVSHEPHFSLLREEVKFTRPRKGGSKKPQKKDSEEKQFHLLHLSLLREYLAWEFSSLKDLTKFKYDGERIVDDWILMGLLIGNDFLPNIPNVHIHDNAFPLLYETYKRVLPTLDGYINESGYLNLSRFEAFLRELSKNDRNVYVKQMDDAEWLNAKKSQPKDEYGDFMEFQESDNENKEDIENEEIENEKVSDKFSDAAFVSSDEEEDDESTSENNKVIFKNALDNLNFDISHDDGDEDSFGLNFMDENFENDVDALWTKAISNSFKRHKNSYYNEKLKYNNISKNELKAQAEGYVKAIQWNLHYYYHGCASWSWYYPHHYAPFISDVIDFSDLKIEFEKSEPFKPFEQLLSVLPASSKECLPKPFQELMNNDPAISPIYDFFLDDFETDLNGKKNEWESVVLIPFINEKRLLDAVKSKVSQLSKEEIARNTHGSHILFTSNTNSDGFKLKIIKVDKDEFRIDKSKVVWGLLPNVKMDVYFPGFPTMKHLTHRAELVDANINVFGFDSREKSIVLKVKSVDEANKFDIIELAGELLQQEVCIDWPILKLAKVDSIWGDEKIIKTTDNEEIIVKEMTPEDKNQWTKIVKNTLHSLYKRYGIEIEEKKESEKVFKQTIVWVRKFAGLVYQVDHNGKNLVMKATKEFHSNTYPVILSLVVRDVLLENSKKLAELPIDKAYPLKSVVWVKDINSSLYGVPSMVQGYENKNSSKCTVRLMGMVFNSQIDKLEKLKQSYSKQSLRWMAPYEAAKQANVNVSLFTRITGTILLWNEEKKLVESGRQLSGDKKLNIGLNLKFTKKNICVMDYTERIDVETHRGPNKVWKYSNLTSRLVIEYKKRFPEIFKCLGQSNDYNDFYYTEDIWKKVDVRNKRFEELKEFLENLPCFEAERVECGTDYADRQIISGIERILEDNPKAHMKTSLVSASSLYRAELYDGKSLVDSDADFQILDRVSCVSSRYSIPMTLQGTIVGIHGEKIDVLFDKEFPNGVNVRGSKKASSIRLPKTCLFNLTYGLIRKNKKKEEKLKKGRNDEFKALEGAYVPWKPNRTEKDPLDLVSKEIPSTSHHSASLSKEKTSKIQIKLKKRDEKDKVDEVKGLTELLNKLNIPKATTSNPEVQQKEEIGKKISLAELLGGGSQSPIKNNKEEEDSVKFLMKKIETSAKKCKETKNIQIEDQCSSSQSKKYEEEKIMRPQQFQSPQKIMQPPHYHPQFQFAPPMFGGVPQNNATIINTQRPMMMHPGVINPFIRGSPIHRNAFSGQQSNIIQEANFPNHLHQQQQQSSKEKLTDFKPSTVTNSGRTNNQRKINTKKPRNSNESKSEPSVTMNSSTSSQKNRRKKKKQSRLGVNFENKKD